jgi:hypothetical protein
MRPVELTRSGFVHGGRVLPGAVTPGICPYGQFGFPDRPVDRTGEPHILAAIQLFTCQRELHAAQGAKCRVGHASETPDFDCGQLACLRGWLPPLSHRSKRLFDMPLRSIHSTDHSRQHPCRTPLDQKFSGLLKRRSGRPNVIHEYHRHPLWKRPTASPGESLDAPSSIPTRQRGLARRQS